MEDIGERHFEHRKEFRQWLEEHHLLSPGIWMVFYKKHTGRPNIGRREATEEALCFGWIDSIIKKVNEEKYVVKFTPRTNYSNWSDVNKKLVLRLIRENRMTEAGLNKIAVYREKGVLPWKEKELEKKKQPFEIPSYILDTLASNEPALTHFNSLAPSYQKQYVGWITSAKKEETREKRLKEAIQYLIQNKKLGMK